MRSSCETLATSSLRCRSERLQVGGHAVERHGQVAEFVPPPGAHPAAVVAVRHRAGHRGHLAQRRGQPGRHVLHEPQRGDDREDGDHPQLGVRVDRHGHQQRGHHHRGDHQVPQRRLDRAERVDRPQPVPHPPPEAALAAAAPRGPLAGPAARRGAPEARRVVYRVAGAARGARGSRRVARSAGPAPPAGPGRPEEPGPGDVSRAMPRSAFRRRAVGRAVVATGPGSPARSRRRARYGCARRRSCGAAP